MNPLRELLDAERDPSVSDIRSATTASVQALRHDRRVRLLGLDETHAVVQDLVHTPDVRTLVVTTRPYTREMAEAGVQHEEPESYRHQMLFDVVDPRSLEDEWLRWLQQWVLARGSQMRVATVPFRANIYDCRFVLMARDFDDNSAGTVAVSEPDLVASLVDLHARLWRGGSRWDANGGGLRGSTVDLSDVLAQLLEGRTDEAAAANLHISLRTYRRRVQDLLTLLGTQSRFQAGAVANARRYIDLVRPPSWPEPAAPDAFADALSRLPSLPG